MKKVKLVALMALASLSGCNKAIDSSMKALDNTLASVASATKDSSPPPRVLSGAVKLQVKENNNSEYYRFIDPEAGVVCYAGAVNTAFSCVPLSQTKLAQH